MVERIEITGGAGAHLAAAIAAVVEAIDREEQEASATRPKPIRQSQWVQVGRTFERQSPIASADYDRIPNGTNGENGEINPFT
ncbi:MAG: hypothetical protein M5U23_12375 [Acidimicrobiia bacterium]|nr:hypothetical protein [Acidimicrobiia bacterium]